MPIQSHTMSFVIVCGILWHPVLCNPVRPRHFCALPSECLALWQHQQLNMSVHHEYLVPRSLPVNISPATVESDALYVSVFMVLHILHTRSSPSSGFSLVQHTSHTKIKTLHTSKSAMVTADYPSNLTYLWYPLTAVQ